MRLFGEDNKIQDRQQKSWQFLNKEEEQFN